MSQTPNTVIAVIGIDIGKNSFHVVGHDARGAIVLRRKWSRGQVEARLANIPPHDKPPSRHTFLRRDRSIFQAKTETDVLGDRTRHGKSVLICLGGCPN